MTRHSQYERVEEISGHKFIIDRGKNKISFWNAMTAIERAQTALSTATARAFKLLPDPGSELFEFDLERLESRIEDLADHINWYKREIDKLKSLKATKDKIAQLRNTTGRTPQEAAEFLRKADALEAKLNEN